MGKDNGRKTTKRKEKDLIESDGDRPANLKKSKLLQSDIAKSPLATKGKHGRLSKFKTKAAKSVPTGTPLRAEDANNNAQVQVVHNQTGKSPVKALRSRTITRKSRLDLDQGRKTVDTAVVEQVSKGTPLLGGPNKPVVHAGISPSKQTEETAYERIFNKVQADRKRRGVPLIGEEDLVSVNDLNTGAGGSSQSTSKPSRTPGTPAKGKSGLEMDGQPNEVVIQQDGMKMAVTASDDEFLDDSDSDNESDSFSDSPASGGESSSSSGDSTEVSDVESEGRSSEDRQSEQGVIESSDSEAEHSHPPSQVSTSSSKLTVEHPEVKSLAKTLARRKWQRKKDKYLRKIQKLKQRNATVTSNKKKSKKGTDQQRIVTATPARVMNKNYKHDHQLIKSPSDTTLYAPALQKGGGDDAINKISNFVESIRLDKSADRNTPTIRDDSRAKRQEDVRASAHKTAEDISEHAII